MLPAGRVQKETVLRANFSTMLWNSSAGKTEHWTVNVFETDYCWSQALLVRWGSFSAGVCLSLYLYSYMYLYMYFSLKQIIVRVNRCWCGEDRLVRVCGLGGDHWWCRTVAKATSPGPHKHATIFACGFRIRSQGTGLYLRLRFWNICLRFKSICCRFMKLFAGDLKVCSCRYVSGYPIDLSQIH